MRKQSRQIVDYLAADLVTLEVRNIHTESQVYVLFNLWNIQFDQDAES